VRTSPVDNYFVPRCCLFLYFFGIGLTQLDYITSLRSFWTLDNCEFNRVPFVQGFVSLAHNCRVVDKYILTAIAPDEAVTFLVIEPLDHTFHNGTAHCNSLHVLLLLGGHYEKGWWMSIGTQPIVSMPIVCIVWGSSNYVRIPRNSSPGLTFRALASFTIVTRDRFRLPLSIAPTNVTCNPANSANRS